MKIYCIRHGDAVTGEDDASRPLSPMGREQATALGQYLSQQGVSLASIATSPRVRAKETASRIAEAMGLPEQVLHFDDCLLDESASVTDFIEQASCWQDGAAFVGHMPFMEQLVTTLVMGGCTGRSLVNYHPATAVCLEQIGSVGNWAIRWALHPELL